MAFETSIGTLDFKRAEEHYAKMPTMNLHYARADAARTAKLWEEDARVGGKYLDEVSVIVQEIQKRRHNGRW